MRMNHTPPLVAAFSLLAALSAAPAHAVSVSYYLDQSNVMADGINYLRVDIESTSAGTAMFTVTPTYSFTQLSNYGLQSFGFNFSGANLSSITASNFTLPAGWTADLPPPTGQDGFGKYDFVVQDGGSARVSPLSFTVTGLGGATSAETLSYFAKLSTGGSSQFFAAHLAGIDTGDPNNTSAYFAGSAPVPEADTWAMMLAGLGVVGLLARRRQQGAA